jgi:3-oxoacyl-[acyl-carrier-protein] synthase-3
MDVNTACTSFLYSLSTATALVRTGAAHSALVIGVELIAQYMDWENRNVAVLFGDGCGAAVVQATDKAEGLLGEQLGCMADVRHILRIRGMGCNYANRGVVLGDTEIDFDGPEVFRRAVLGMSQASSAVMEKCGVTAGQIDLVVPHQANLRIIEAVAARSGISMEKVMLTVQRYGNMSSATVPVALVEAVEQGRVKPGSLILMPAFGAGLTLCAHLVRWGERVEPIRSCDEELPPCTRTALEMVNDIRARKARSHAASHPGMQIPR